MKIENARFNTKVKCKKSFYLPELIGKVGVVSRVEEDGFVVVNYPMHYSNKLHNANGTSTSDNNFYILPSDLKLVKG